MGMTEKTAMSGNVSCTRRLSRSSPQGQIRNNGISCDDDEDFDDEEDCVEEALHEVSAVSKDSEEVGISSNSSLWVVVETFFETTSRGDFLNADDDDDDDDDAAAVTGAGKNEDGLLNVGVATAAVTH
jgi:hypothetical protein